MPTTNLYQTVKILSTINNADIHIQKKNANSYTVVSRENNAEQELDREQRGGSNTIGELSIC
jgi:hypothetical protein